MCAKAGNVLIIADGEKAAARLSRWVASAGEMPVVVHGADTQIFERGDDATIDAVVTDLDVDEPAARRILDNLGRGDLFSRVPQIHVLRDSGLEHRDSGDRRDPASLLLPEPIDPAEFVAQLRRSAEIGRLRREVSDLTHRDELTQGSCRRHLESRLEEEFSRSRRHDSLLSLVLFCIDPFDAIRVRFGTDGTNTAIRHVSRLLGPRLRREDIYGRWDSSTFAVILPGSAYRGAASLANQVRGDVENVAVTLSGERVPVRISGGVSSYRPDGSMEVSSDLLSAAEAALEEAKARGGNRVFIDEALLRTERRLILIADADAALLDPAEDLLSLDDYEVARADSVEALLGAVRRRRPDLVILDLHIAGDVSDATPLVDQLQALHPDRPIPLVGLARPTALPPQRSGRRPKVDRYLTRPFSMTVLRSLAHDLI
jgi:diguanylate cyclase (GGDEF)-like protein